MIFSNNKIITTFFTIVFVAIDYASSSMYNPDVCMRNLNGDKFLSSINDTSEMIRSISSIQYRTTPIKDYKLKVGAKYEDLVQLENYNYLYRQTFGNALLYSGSALNTNTWCLLFGEGSFENCTSELEGKGFKIESIVATGNMLSTPDYHLIPYKILAKEMIGSETTPGVTNNGIRYAKYILTFLQSSIMANNILSPALFCYNCCIEEMERAGFLHTPVKQSLKNIKTIYSNRVPSNSNSKLEKVLTGDGSRWPAMRKQYDSKLKKVLPGTTSSWPDLRRKYPHSRAFVYNGYADRYVVYLLAHDVSEIEQKTGNEWCDMLFNMNQMKTAQEE